MYRINNNKDPWWYRQSSIKSRSHPCFFCSGSHVFCEQSGGAIQFHGAGLWAGLKPEQEHVGSCGLRSGWGQEEGETDGGERRIPPAGGVVGGIIGRLWAEIQTLFCLFLWPCTINTFWSDPPDWDGRSVRILDQNLMLNHDEFKCYCMDCPAGEGVSKDRAWTEFSLKDGILVGDDIVYWPFLPIN